MQSQVPWHSRLSPQNKSFVKKYGKKKIPNHDHSCEFNNIIIPLPFVGHKVITTNVGLWSLDLIGY